MKPIYGIDLGTTYTKCALVNPSDSRMQVFLLDKGGKDVEQNQFHFMRSAVTVGMLDERKVAFVGSRSFEEYDDAEDEAAVRRFEETKIYIGEDLTQLSDPPPWRFEPHQWGYRPEDIGALVLRKVKKEVEAARGPTMERIVVTHPQYFTDTRRKATRQAAEIAGLEVVDMLTEPDAAALSFHAEAAPGTYMIFDLGGGTLDVTVCQIEPRRLTVLASDGLKEGGRDFDRLIYSRMADEYQALYPDFDRVYVDTKTEQTWLRHAERVKRGLNEQEALRITYLCNNRRFPDGQKKSIVVKRAEFHAMAQPLVAACIKCAERTLGKAQLRWKDLVAIIPVGSSTLLAPLRQALEAASGFKLAPPDEYTACTAIARGAAIHAYNLATEATSILSSSAGQTSVAERAKVALVGVLARHLGVKAYDHQQGGFVTFTLVKGGTQLPCSQKQTFSTLTDNDQSIEVILLEYEREHADPDEADEIGRVVLSGFAPGPAGSPVDVTIKIEQNGSKHMVVSAMGLQREASIEFNPNCVVAPADIARRRQFIASIQIM